MTRNVALSIVLAAAVLAAGQPLGAAEPKGEPLARLDAVLEAMKTHTFAGDQSAVRELEAIVVEAAKDPAQCKAAEAKLAAALGGECTVDCKRELCRRLRTIGTARSVPPLAALLTDEALSHMARFALGYMQAPEALAALRQALGKTSGKVQVGIIGSLGARRDAEAVPALVKLVGGKDAQVAEATVGALGRIGGAEARAALDKALAGASGKRRAAVVDALLACADRALAAGQKDQAAATFRKLYGDKEAGHVRIAALRGLVVAGGDEAIPLVLTLVRSDDRATRANAIGFVRRFEGTAATQRFAKELPGLAPDAQVLLIEALAERDDPAAKPAILAATHGEHEAVRAAALLAVGRLGDASSVPLLVQGAASGRGAEQAAARTALVRLAGDGVDAAIVEAMEKAEPKLRVELIRALTARQADGVVASLLAAARDADESVRREAIKGLGVLGGEPHLAGLVDILVKAKTGGERAAAERAVAAILRRVDGRGRQEAPVLAALEGAMPDARAALLRLLGRTASPKALKAVRTAFKDTNPAMHLAALRILADWPTAAPIDDLRRIARTAAEPAHKVLALRGLVRMINLPSDREADETTELYVEAMELAERPEEKKLVLAGLSSAASPEVVAIVEPLLDKAALRAEATQAMLSIARNLAGTHRAEAVAALRSVIGVARSRRERTEAKKLLDEIEKYEGFIVAWEVAGPLTAEGKTGEHLLDVAFDPEKPGAEGVRWKRLTSGVAGWQVDLAKAFPGNHRVVYLRTSIQSAIEQMVRLEIGSDDGVKVWLNGKVVHTKNVVRGLAAAQDKVVVSLREGWNPLLVKVSQVDGGWGLCVRVRDTSGSSAPGIRVLPGRQGER